MSRGNYGGARTRIGPQGEPWSIMYSNVINTMERACALHKLDLTLEDVIVPCLPGELEEDDVRWNNLRAALHYGTYSNFRFPYGAQFWIQNEGDDFWPTPSTPDNGFVIAAVHPHAQQLHEWVTKATELDATISEAKVYLNRLLRVLKHPKWVDKFWPSLKPYVGELPEAMIKSMREPRPTALNQDMPLQDEIETLLTTAALLPKGYKPKAWLGVMHGGS